MNYYILMLVLIVISAYWEMKGYRYRFTGSQREINFSLLVPCMILFFFAATRAVTVGADTRQYQIVFELCKEESWKNLAVSTVHMEWVNLKDIEVGYRYYNKLLSYIWDNPQVITIANSFFVVFPLYRLIKRYSTNQWMSIFLFFTFGFYQTSLNLTPSAIASLIALNGLEYIEKRQPVKYLTCILLASIFHYSSFIFLLLYFIGQIELNSKRFFGILISSCVLISIAFTGMISYLLYFVPARYRVYMMGNADIEQILVYVVQLVLVLFCIWKEGKREEFWNQNQILMWFFLAESVAYFFSVFAAENFARIAFLFSPLLVITIPNLIWGNKEDEKMEVLDSYIYRIEKIALFIVVYGIGIYFARIAVNNIGTTMPYEFFY